MSASVRTDQHSRTFASLGLLARAASRHVATVKRFVQNISTPSDVQRSQCIVGDVEGEGDPEGDLEHTIQTHVSAD